MTFRRQIVTVTTAVLEGVKKPPGVDGDWNIFRHLGHNLRAFTVTYFPWKPPIMHYRRIATAPERCRLT
jgi:hypothetical protein